MFVINQKYFGYKAANISFMHAVESAESATDVASIINKINSTGAVDVNYNGHFSKQSPLMLAKSPEVARALINNGANVDATTWDGTTALMSNKNPEVIEVILSKTPLLRANDNKGRDALMLHSASPEIVKMLLDHGAGHEIKLNSTASLKGVNAQDNSGNTPLMHALKGSNVEDVRESVRLLIEAGTDLNLKNDKGNTALMLTTDPEIAKMLIQAGARLDIKNEDLKTVHDLNRGSEFKAVINDSKALQRQYLSDLLDETEIKPSIPSPSRPRLS